MYESERRDESPTFKRWEKGSVVGVEVDMNRRFFLLLIIILVAVTNILMKVCEV